MAKTNGSRVIDGDGHVVEPFEMWQKYLEPEFRKRAPRLVEDNWGTPRALYENMFFQRGPGYDCGLTQGWAATGAFKHHGAGDPHERIKDMDMDGPIEIAVLFPTFMLGVPSVVQDPRYEAAMCRAYNNWINDYASAYPKRLRPIIVPPVTDIKETVAEIRRCRKMSPLFVGIMLPSNIYGKNLQHPEFYPIWQEAQELDLAVCPHTGTGTNAKLAGTDRYNIFFQTHCINFPFENMMNVLDFVTGGILELFPRLRVSFMESGVGWVPYWMERLDEHYERLASEVPLCKKRPSEYMKSEQCYFSSDPDEKLIPLAIEFLGEDRIIYASDYPHWDCRFPGTVDEILKQKISDSAKAKILGENAKRLFKIV